MADSISAGGRTCYVDWHRPAASEPRGFWGVSNRADTHIGHEAMTTIKIRATSENASAISAAIKQAEGRARERVLTADDVLSAITEAEERLAALCIPKKAWAGVVVCVEERFHLPAAYRGLARYTSVTVTRVPTRISSGWFVTAVGRVQGNSALGERLILTAEARSAIPTEHKL